jgi:hypothetical protein
MKTISNVSYYKEMADSGLFMFFGLMFVITVSTAFVFFYIFSGTPTKTVESRNNSQVSTVPVSQNSFPSSASLSAY